MRTKMLSFIKNRYSQPAWLRVLNIICFVLIMTAGCSKSDDRPHGAFVCEEIQYPLTKGIVARITSPPAETYRYDISVYSGFVNAPLSGGYTFVGSGCSVSFQDIICTSSTGLNTGKYTFNPTEKLPGTFSVGEVLINWDIETQTGQHFYVKDGSISLISNNKTYTMVFSVTCDDGRVIYGNFGGELSYEHN